MSAGRDELAARVEVVLARGMLAVALRDGFPDAIAALRDRLATGEAQLTRVRSGDRPLDEIAAALGLDGEQTEFLWAAIAVSCEPRLAPHAEALGGSAARRGLSAATYEVLAAPGGSVGRDLALWLAGPNPLVAHGLLTCTDDTLAPAVRPYGAPVRLIDHLRGVSHAQPRISLSRPPATDALVFDETQERTLKRLSAALHQARALVVLEGPAGGGRRSAIARAADGPVATLDVAGLSVASLGDALLALRREALLADAVPVIERVDELDADALRALGRALDAWPTTVAFTSAVRALDLSTGRSLIRFDWPAPATAARRRLWLGLAGATDDAALDGLAIRYPVGPGTIARAVESARLLDPETTPPTAAALETGLRHNIAEKLGGIAQRVEVTQTWDDLVLADDTRDQVRALVARVRHAHAVLEGWGYRSKMARGTGVPALFSGLPGTGKTMVAGLIARELDLELYQVDLSQVVSKWVGETEKQLARIFDVAEQGHALLLFDEADALFGQRTTETRGAVDRYANLEVNFLLQRVESFGGVTILTTNLDAAIDRALKRRLAAHIVFDLPDEDERAALWQRMITTAASPLAHDLDLARLAHDFAKMSGANIRNAALGAAFFAADEGSREIRQDHLVRAARVEYRSMGHVLADRHGR